MAATPYGVYQIIVSMSYENYLHTVHRGSTDDFHFASDFQWCCLADQGSSSVTQHVSVESSSLLLHGIKM